VVKTFRNTTNDQITFSPEFTTCNACNRTSRGLSETCPFCASGDVDGITRITGYFTRLSSWNKGKLGELRDRYRNNFNGGAHEKGLDLYEQHLSALPRS
jgi:ribonucleoside-triphosphate reductase